VAARVFDPTTAAYAEFFVNRSKPLRLFAVGAIAAVFATHDEVIE
jgi:hypothetical protein